MDKSKMREMRNRIKLLIAGMENCLSDDFENYYQSDIHNWQSELSDIEWEFYNPNNNNNAISTENERGSILLSKRERDMYEYAKNELNKIYSQETNRELAKAKDTSHRSGAVSNDLTLDKTPDNIHEQNKELLDKDYSKTNKEVMK